MIFYLPPDEYILLLNRTKKKINLKVTNLQNKETKVWGLDHDQDDETS